jgi:hypothetical protein
MIEEITLDGGKLRLLAGVSCKLKIPRIAK